MKTIRKNISLKTIIKELKLNEHMIHNTYKLYNTTNKIEELNRIQDLLNDSKEYRSKLIEIVKNKYEEDDYKFLINELKEIRNQY